MFNNLLGECVSLPLTGLRKQFSLQDNEIRLLAARILHLTYPKAKWEKVNWHGATLISISTSISTVSIPTGDLWIWFTVDMRGRLFWAVTNILSKILQQMVILSGAWQWNSFGSPVKWLNPGQGEHSTAHCLGLLFSLLYHLPLVYFSVVISCSNGTLHLSASVSNWMISSRRWCWRNISPVP